MLCPSKKVEKATREQEQGQDQDKAGKADIELSSNIEVIPAKNKCGPYFILSTGREIAACDPADLFRNRNNLGVLYPCHVKCLEIAAMSADARSQPYNQVIRHIYRVLTRHMRRVCEQNGTVQPHTNLRNTSKYGNLGQLQGLIWDDTEEGADVSMTLS